MAPKISWQNLFEIEALPFLLLLLGLDGLFILVHFLRVIPLLHNPAFALNQDFGYAEMYLYGKELLSVALLLAVLVRTRTIGYAVWAVLFLTLLLDDALQFHERFGFFVAANVNFTTFLGLRAQDFGELAVYGAVAASFLLLLSLAYRRSPAPFRVATHRLLLLLLALAVFGVVVDMVLIALDLGWKVDYVLVAVEDGGELTVMSLMVHYLYLLYRRVSARLS
jgi:hypothetical protein